MSRDPWPDNSPDQLYDICIQYCVRNIGKVISDKCQSEVRFGTLNLSHVVNQHLFLECVRAGVLSSKKTLDIFLGQNQVKLARLNLSTVTDLMDEDLEQLLIANSPSELHLGPANLTPMAVNMINTFGRSLTALHFTNAAHFLLGSKCTIPISIHTHLNCPNLRFLTLHRLMPESRKLLDMSLSRMPHLVALNLFYSDIDVSELECLQLLSNLQILSLHNVLLRDLESAFKIIAAVKSLRVLDLGQSRLDEPVMYEGDVHGNMRYLVSHLPLLTRLELAGTNLAGRLERAPVSHRPEKCQSCVEEERKNQIQFAIPGLEGRCMEYLGLLNCAHDACDRENLPAKQVTGDANEDQVLLAVHSYIERQELLLMSLNHLFHLFKHQDCSDHKRALEGILAAMKAYKEEKTIQISGSATLFYIVKGDCKHFFTTKKKKVPTATLR